MSGAAPCTAVPLVELCDVTRTFGGASPVVVLRQCNLRIFAGDSISISGRSGAGKSTLLNLLGLLDSATSGAHMMDGIDVSRLSDGARSSLRARSIGFIFQDYRLINYRTVLDNVQVGLIYSHVSKRRRKDLALEALAAVGMTYRTHASSAVLSGGERQRVAIARAVANSPRFILADEPTGNLDQANANAILDVLDALHSAGHTIVMVTHDPLVASRCSTHIRIVDGELTCESSDT